MAYKTPRGTKDILPAQIDAWTNIERKARDLFATYGYREVRTPIFEQQNLFIRSLGETSDIVQKQLLNLAGDKKDELCLRPEATASNVRLYIEHGIHKTQGFAKFCYIGPMFRAERPQKGRLRQFHHIGAEAMGATNPYLDAEVVSVAVNLLKEFGIQGYKIKINNLGCPKDRKKITAITKKALENKLPELCENCQDRFQRNVLRIFDCKIEKCKRVVEELQLGDEHLCGECRIYFQEVLEALDILDIAYIVSPHLVRGLDYYTRTVFEIVHSDLGSQDALGAGGRYDGLIHDLGGPDLGAVGFALGMERLMLVLPKKEATPKSVIDAYIATIGLSAQKVAIRMLDTLRRLGISCDTDYEGVSLKSQMRTANRLNAKCVILLGDDEIDKGIVTLKDLHSGTQTPIKQDHLPEAIKARYRL